MEEKTFYIDIEQLSQNYNGVPGIGIINGEGEALELLWAGKNILSMPASDRRERAYQILAEEYDVRFIFDDEIPEMDFYPIPQLSIFAVDHVGGCFGSTNVNVDLSEEDAPIYYVNNKLQCFRLAANLLEFIHLVESHQLDWKSGVAEEIKIYPSFEAAKKEILYYDIGDLLKMKEVRQ